jgi:hypothetical protein
MRKGKVGIPSEEHAENNDDETHRDSGFDGGFHCSFTNSELEQRNKRNRNAPAMNTTNRASSGIGSPPYAWLAATPKAEEHHRKDSSGLVRKTGAKYGK